MNRQPLIIYVPGLLPKPEAATHRSALLRCLLSGVTKLDGDVAAQIASDPAHFDLVSWSYDFYAEHRDFELDAAAVDDVISKTGPGRADRLEAASLRRRFVRWLYTLGDLLPFLIPHIASERMEIHLRDLRRYVQNRNDIAEHTRQMLKVPLRAAASAGRPVLLIAHSMGSVIAYESLWQLSRATREDVSVDVLLTMGSPLGQRYIQRRIKGYGAIGAVRYPDNIRRWVNLAASGDLTAIDPTLANDFAAMTRLGLIGSIEDHEIVNWYRWNGELNTHSEYGYLVNPATAAIVTDWWSSLSPGRDSAV